jgi:hypothetical protein
MKALDGKCSIHFIDYECKKIYVYFLYIGLRISNDSVISKNSNIFLLCNMLKHVEAIRMMKKIELRVGRSQEREDELDFENL